MTSRETDERSRRVDELRRSWGRGESPSALLRDLLGHGLRGAQVVTLMQDAFALSLSTTNAITAWLSYGDDARLDRFLTPKMPGRGGASDDGR